MLHCPKHTSGSKKAGIIDWRYVNTDSSWKDWISRRVLFLGQKQPIVRSVAKEQPASEAMKSRIEEIRRLCLSIQPGPPGLTSCKLHLSGRIVVENVCALSQWVAQPAPTSVYNTTHHNTESIKDHYNATREEIKGFHGNPDDFWTISGLLGSYWEPPAGWSSAALGLWSFCLHWELARTSRVRWKWWASCDYGPWSYYVLLIFLALSECLRVPESSWICEALSQLYAA